MERAMHETPEFRPRIGLGKLHASIAVTDVMFWAILGLVLVLVAPRFKEIATDFGVELSGLSAATFALSDWLAGRGGQAVPGIVWAAMLVLLASFAIVWLTSMQATRWLGVVLLVLWGIVPLLLVVLGVVAVYLPLVGMIESLQSANP
jgi:hypothetical protein